MIENMLRRKAEQNAEERRLMADRNQIWQNAISAGGRLADKMFSDEDKLRQLEAERAALDEQMGTPQTGTTKTITSQTGTDQTGSAQKVDWNRSPFENSSTRSEVSTSAQPTWLEEQIKKAMEEARREKNVAPLPQEYSDISIEDVSRMDDRAIEDAIRRAKLQSKIKEEMI